HRAGSGTMSGRSPRATAGDSHPAAFRPTVARAARQIRQLLPGRRRDHSATTRIRSRLRRNVRKYQGSCGLPSDIDLARHRRRDQGGAQFLEALDDLVDLVDECVDFRRLAIEKLDDAVLLLRWSERNAVAPQLYCRQVIDRVRIAASNEYAPLRKRVHY